MRTNVLIGSVALTLATALFAGCGSGGSSSHSTGSYCSELKADKSYFDGLNGSGSDASSLTDVFAKIHGLAKDAPSNVAADWKTLDGAVTTIENALASAGLKPSDLASLQSGKLPPGVDAAKLQAIAPKLQALSSSGVGAAADRIAADAKKSCGVDLTSS